MREPVQIVEIDVDVCSLTYGSAPCTAVLGTTGVRKCYNMYRHCQDPENFAQSTLTLRFAQPRADIFALASFVDEGDVSPVTFDSLPLTFDAIPLTFTV